MISSIDSAIVLRNRRIIETLEDAFMLLRFHFPTSFEKNRLNNAVEQLRLASEATLLRLFQDPKVQMWCLVDLTPLTRGEGSADAAKLADELQEDLNSIALGIAHLEHRTFRMVARNLPAGIFIPGTGVALDYANETSEAEIIAESNGTFKANGSLVVQRQWLASAGLTIPTGDVLFMPPALDGYELENLDTELASQWARLFAQIRPLLNASPRHNSLVSAFGSFVLPLKPSKSGNHLSVSFKHWPAIVYASWSDDSSEVLEAIVHEADHQCLFEVINDGPLLTDGAINTRASFRSPWRNDPRPLSGIFFGFSAFVTVGNFWEALLTSRTVTTDQIGYRAVLALERSLDAISTVSMHADLTDKGMDLLKFNRHEAEISLKNLERHTEFKSWQRRSQETQAENAANWKRAHGGGADVVVS